MKRILSLALVLAICLSCLVLTGAVAEGKVYRTYIATDVPTLNSHDTVETSLQTVYDYSGAFMCRAVPNAAGTGFEYVGEIAEAVPTQIDEHTWQFVIRKEACWADGTPINADTFIYSYKMLLDPVMANQMANFLYDNNITIVNGKEYAMQTAEAPVAWEEVGIKKVDEYTIQITTVNVNTVADVCAHFANRPLAPVYEPLYEAGMNEDRTATSYGATKDQYMACGPFYLDTWTYGSVQVYKRNNNYWLPEMFKIEEIDLNVIPEMNARVQMWEKGELDNLGLSATTIETYIDDPRTLVYPSHVVMHFDVNCANPNNPLSGSINYRKAMYYAIDRVTIAEDLFGYQEPAGTYISGQAGILAAAGVPYRQTPEGIAVTDYVETFGPYGYNPELAYEYLLAAYEEMGVDPNTTITLTLLLDEGDGSADSWKAALEFIMEQFPVIFHGKVQCEVAAYSGISTTKYKQQTDVWDLSHNDWGRAASRTYPYQALYYFTSSYPSSPNNFHDEEFDAQFAHCDEVKEDYAQMLIETQKLEMIYLDKVIQIPVIQCVNYEMMSEKIILPVKQYIPGFGWGNLFADIAE